MRQLNLLLHIAPENEASIFRTRRRDGGENRDALGFDYGYRLQREDTNTGKFVQTRGMPDVDERIVGAHGRQGALWVHSRDHDRQRNTSAVSGSRRPQFSWTTAKSAVRGRLYSLDRV